MTIELSCRAGKTTDNQICLLTSLEPDKAYLRSIGNNKGVTIIYSSGPKYPDFTRFPFPCTTGPTSCTTWSYRHPRHLLLRPTPLHKPNFWGVTNVMRTLYYKNIQQHTYYNIPPIMSWFKVQAPKENGATSSQRLCCSDAEYPCNSALVQR